MGTYHGQFTILPEITPNKFMLENHKDKGNEPWEIFANVCREIISEHSGLPMKSNVPIQDRLEYCKLIQMQEAQVEINEKIYKLPQDLITPKLRAKLAKREKVNEKDAG